MSDNRTNLCRSLRYRAVLAVLAVPFLMGDCGVTAQTRLPIGKAAEEKPFDPSVEKLPPQYKGNSIPGLFQALTDKKRVLDKSEYETQAAYDERIAKLSDEKLLGLIPLTGLVAIVPSCNHSDFRHRACDTEYDAETQTLRIESPIEQYSSIFVREEDGPVRPAGIAHTALGAKFQYSTMNVTKYEIDAKDPDWYQAKQKPHLTDGEDFTQEIALPPDEAKQSAGAVRVLIIGRVTAPFVDEIESHIDPAKTTWPLESHMQFRRFSMEITAVWFFNVRTGQVYKRLSAETAN